MARDIGTKIFRVSAPAPPRSYYNDDVTEVHIRVVVHRRRAWYEDNCSDLSECGIRLCDWNERPC
jgi:hypothetical protein